MSEIITNKLTGKTAAGNVTITSEGGSATMQLQQGVAKMFSVTNSAGTSVTDSLNVSSLTDTGTGQQTLNLSNAFDTATYSCAGSLASAGGYHLALATFFTNKFTSYAFTTAYLDQEVRATAYGDLA